MAGAVHEPLPQPGGGDRLAGRGVHLLGGDARAHRGAPPAPGRPAARRRPRAPRRAARRRRRRCGCSRSCSRWAAGRRCRSRRRRRARSPGRTRRGAGSRRSARSRRSRTRRRCGPPRRSRRRCPRRPAPRCGPGLQELAHPGVHPVDRRAGRAQLGDLGGVLAHPQLAQHRPGQRSAPTSGSASRSPNTCAAGIESATATRVGPPARSLTSRYGSSPSAQVTTSTPSSSSGEPGQPGRLQPRHHERGRGPVPGRRAAPGR